MWGLALRESIHGHRHKNSRRAAVMFDLPVVEEVEREAATDFRNGLLDHGFAMSQFSVYMRFAPVRRG